ncbi:MAG: diacylglycerol/lipid kinase family protein [bacterium JZ-2024 1]
MTVALFSYRKTISRKPGTFNRVRSEVMRRFEDARVVIAESPDDLAAEVRRICHPRLVLSAGGDGLLRDLINLYCRARHIWTASERGGEGAVTRPHPQGPSFAILPMGTGNETARALGIPMDPVRAIPMPTSKRITVFTGELQFERGFVVMNMARDIYRKEVPIQFVNSAGTGIDSATVVAREAFARLRVNHYVLTFVFGVLPKLRPFKVRVKTGEQVLYSGDSVWVIALRGRFVGKGILLDPSSDIRKPEVRLLVVKGASRFQVLRTLPSVLGGHAHRSPLVESFSGESFHLDFMTPRPISVDGDIVGVAEGINLKVSHPQDFLLPALIGNRSEGSLWGTEVLDLP